MFNFYCVISHTLINFIHNTARKNRKPRSALPYLNEALTTYRACYGSKHPVVADTLCSIASIYKGFHKYNEAINIDRKAMLIREVTEGENSVGVAEILVSMGSIKEKQKLYDEAQSHYEDALRMYNMVHKAPHADTAQTITSLALVFKLQKKYDMAKDYYNRALEMRRALHPTAVHPDIAQAMNNLAALLYSMHEYSEAKVLYEDSLNMLIKLLGTENLDVAQAMNNLAALLFAKKNHLEAEPLYEESLRIRRRLLGSDHLDVASSLCNLGILKRSLRAYDEATAFFEESLTIRMKVLNDDTHPDIRVCKKHLAFLKQLSVDVKVDMRVEVNDRSSGKPLLGTVVKEHRNQLYDIKYDAPNMDVAGYVPRSRITVLEGAASAASWSEGATTTATATPRSNNSSREEGDLEKEKTDEHTLSPAASARRDRVSEDFHRAGSKIVRKAKSSSGSGIKSTSSGSSSNSMSREVEPPPAQVNTAQFGTSSVASAGSSSSSSSRNTSLSSNSGSALEQILEQSQPHSSPSRPEVKQQVTSPGFTKLKNRREVFQDDNRTGSGHGTGRHSGSFHIHHKSSREFSVSSEGQDDDNNGSNNNETNHHHLHKQASNSSKSRYKESLGTAGFRKSNKSFYKELQA